MSDIHALELEFAKNPTLEACIPLCEAYLQQKRYMEAMVVCKKGIRSAPQDARGRVMLARVYLEQGKAPKAEQEMQTALTEMPGNALILEMSGRVMMETGRKDDAIRTLQQALQANPGLTVAPALLQKLGVAPAAPAPVAPPAPAPAPFAAPVAARPVATPVAAPAVRSGSTVAPPPPPVRPTAPVSTAPSTASLASAVDAAALTSPAGAGDANPWNPQSLPPLAGMSEPAPDGHAASAQKPLEHVNDFFAPDTLGFASNDLSNIETAGPGRLTILGFVPKTTGSIKTTLMVFLAVFAVAAGVIGWRYFQSKSTKEVALIMKTVRQAVDEDTFARYKEAIAGIDKALSIDDANFLALSVGAYAHAVLGVQHGEAGSVDKAKELLARAGQTGEKENGYFVAARALVAFDAKSFDQGIADIKSVMDKGGSNALIELEAFRLRAAFKPDDPETQKQLMRLQQEASQSVRASTYLGWHFYRAENWALADKGFSDALQMNRSHPEALIGKSLVDLDRGIGLKERQKEIETNIKQVFAQEEALSKPVIALAHFARAQLLQFQGKSEEAQGDFKKALELDTQNALFDYRRGVALLGMGRAKDALESLKQAVTKAPNEVRYYKRLAEAQSAAGDADGARASLERASQLAPADGEVQLLEARRLRANKQFDAAIEIYKKVPAENNANGYAMAQMGIAAAYRESARAPKAVAQMQDFMSHAPAGLTKESHARLWCELGQAFEAAKKTDDALNSYNTGIEQFQYYPDCHFFLCRMLGAGGEAKQSCEMYLTLAPSGEYAAEAKRRTGK